MIVFSDPLNVLLDLISQHFVEFFFFFLHLYSSGISTHNFPFLKYLCLAFVSGQFWPRKMSLEEFKKDRLNSFLMFDKILL